MHIDILKVFGLRRKHLPIIAVLLSLCHIATSCDQEKDDLISQPTETSTILSGYIETPDGKPLSGIPVSVDFKVTGLISTSVIHKAKGTTDKSGFYKIFFEADNETDQGMHRGYVFSVDFSSLSQDDYIISEKLEYGFTAFKEEWSGSTIKCDFTIPHKKSVDVTIKNSGIPVLDGKYYVKNMFRYLEVEDYLIDDRNPWNDVSTLNVLEGIEIVQDGSTSVRIPCAIGIENTIRLVYSGDESIGYPNGIPASEAKTVEITGQAENTVHLLNWSEWNVKFLGV